MAAKTVLIWPDPLLKQIAEPITDFGTGLIDLIKDINYAMDEEPMAGLSAPQLGVSKRVFICDIDPEDNEGNGTAGREIFICMAVSADACALFVISQTTLYYVVASFSVFAIAFWLKP